MDKIKAKLAECDTIFRIEVEAIYHNDLIALDRRASTVAYNALRVGIAHQEILQSLVSEVEAMDASLRRLLEVHP